MDLRRAFPDFKVTIDRVIEQGDIVVARWTTTMTHEGEFLGFPATGKRHGHRHFDAEGCERKERASSATSFTSRAAEYSSAASAPTSCSGTTS